MASDGHDEVSKEQREFSRRRFLRHAGVAAAAVPLYGGLAEILGEQGASAATYKRNSDNAFFASHPKYKFVMVNHVTTNSFFTATIYGIQDACALTGCSYQWTGSASSIVSQMVSAFNTAIAAKANGIGCCLIDNTAFNAPVDTALSHGIPVIAYNADVSAGVPNNRHGLRRPEQPDRGRGGRGSRSSSTVSRRAISSPGSSRRRERGTSSRGSTARSRSSTKAGVNFVEVGTSATEGAPEYNKISAWYAGHKDVKFMFAVDSGDSDAIAQFIQKNKLKGKVGAAGWDVGTPVVQGINAGNLTFTIDQQAYLQGFDTIMQLYLYNVSGGLMKPTNTDTGLGIVVKSTVKPYLATEQVRGDEREAADPEAARVDPALVVASVQSGAPTPYCCPGGRPAGAAA